MKKEGVFVVNLFRGGVDSKYAEKDIPIAVVDGDLGYAVDVTCELNALYQGAERRWRSLKDKEHLTPEEKKEWEELKSIGMEANYPGFVYLTTANFVPLYSGEEHVTELTMFDYVREFMSPTN